MNASSHHQFDPAGQLSLPERIVDAAEKALWQARVCGHTQGNRPVYIEGYQLDFAKAGAAAAIEVLADDMEKNDGAGHAVLLRMLAQSVRDVPAVTEV